MGKRVGVTLQAQPHFSNHAIQRRIARKGNEAPPRRTLQHLQRNLFIEGKDPRNTLLV